MDRKRTIRGLLAALVATLSLSGCLVEQARQTESATVVTSAADATQPQDETASSTSADSAASSGTVSATELFDLPCGPFPPVADASTAGTDSERESPTPAEEQIAMEPDLWERIREGLRLPQPNRVSIKNELNWYAGNQAYLDRVADRASPYLHLITNAVEERGMPTEIALLPVVESAFQPFAYSHGRAAGLWQFVPGTGRRFGLKQSWWYDGRRDVAEATRAALDYLQYLHKEFDGDWLLALAAYNSGEGTVLRAIRANRRRHKPIDFWSLNLPLETRGYVPKLLAVAAIVADPEAHGVSLEPIPDEPVLAEVSLDSQIDLDLAAELAGISLEEIYSYNPAFNRWATDPNGPHCLLLPIDAVEQFQTNLAEVPPNQRIHWKRHRVRSGESLLVLARHYRTTVDLLRKVNGLRGNTIRAGKTLIIPVARKDLRRYTLSAEQRRRATQATKRQGHRLEHVVRAGDTLWDIARKYNVGVRQLARWNGMATRDPLQPGRRLVIWTKSRKQVSVFNPAHFTHPHEEALHRRIGYTVRRGDSLARISQRFKVSVRNLKRWNKLGGVKYLRPGQHLTVYVDVSRQSGRI